MALPLDKLGTLQTADKIWFDGVLVPWDQATVHVTWPHMPCTLAPACSRGSVPTR